MKYLLFCAAICVALVSCTKSRSKHCVTCVITQVTTPYGIVGPTTVTTRYCGKTLAQISGIEAAGTWDNWNNDTHVTQTTVCTIDGVVSY